MNIHRSWGATIGWAMAAVAFGAIAYSLWQWGGFFGVAFAIGAGLIAVVSVWISVRESGRAPCPACGKNLAGLDAKAAERFAQCKACDRYSVSKSGQLSLVADDFVAREHSFKSRLPGQVQWPHVCAVCAAPATHMVELHESKGPVSYVTEVPHCDQHSDGVKLAPESEEICWVHFRSYAYWTDFTSRNHGQKLAR